VVAGVQRGLFASSGLTVVGTLAATTLQGLVNAVTFNNSGSGVGSELLTTHLLHVLFHGTLLNKYFY
jgi:hypothetical protein